MALFSDVLLTVDYDRTLTAADSTIPTRNTEAIHWFIENGGAFTINTGRSLPMAAPFIGKIPVNAPLLMYNGAAAYDTVSHSFTFQHPVPVDQSTTVHTIESLLQAEILEIQAHSAHYTFSPQPEWEKLYDAVGCAWGYAAPDTDLGPLLKFSICGPIRGDSVGSFFLALPEDVARYDLLEQQLHSLYGHVMDIMRPAPTIIDMQVRGVNKGRSAQELKQALGRKILVCVGDERNDISMLEAADYAFCPSDSALAGMYTDVCPCDEGAVAEVIFEKIPQILGITP